jgi:SNF2 family DNA or RNA helicase
MNYDTFIEQKTQLGGEYGFDPVFMPDMLFDFQKALVEWACRKGRAAIFADCGLGKTPMQLTWAQNVVQKSNGRVLILTPLAVGAQTVREGEKFGIDCYQSRDGKLPDGKNIIITNYEKLHLFNSTDFDGCVCDESSILKNFDGKTKEAVTDFMRKLPFRLLCTATAAPNDYIELGTSSEAIGDLGFTDMLSRFFKKSQKTTSRSDEFRSGLYRFRGHAERDFWRWVCSWARACRKPSDLGFDDGKFMLPPLNTREHVVKAKTRREGWLFDIPAITLNEQRDERKRTLQERCEMAAQIANGTKEPVVSWGYLNTECDLLTKLIPDAVQISGSDSDEKKEEVFNGFRDGTVRVLVTKPVIGAWGLNWQHCNHQTFFPSHSFEQFYQCVRRSWRFGQKRPVTVDVIASEGERGVLSSIERKAAQADIMFSQLVDLMNKELKITKKAKAKNNQEIPSWL